MGWSQGRTQIQVLEEETPVGIQVNSSMSPMKMTPEKATKKALEKAPLQIYSLRKSQTTRQLFSTGPPSSNVQDLEADTSTPDETPNLINDLILGKHPCVTHHLIQNFVSYHCLSPTFR